MGKIWLYMGLKMATRKNLGRGRGKGYKNLLGSDSKVHSMSAKGIKQPQKMNFINNMPSIKIKCPVCNGNGFLTKSKSLILETHFQCNFCGGDGIITKPQYVKRFDEIRLQTRTEEIRLDKYFGKKLSDNETTKIQNKAYDNIMKKGVFVIDKYDAYKLNDEDYLKPSPKPLKTPIPK